LATARISNKLHNKGLERLKAGDFFHGIEFLQKSITINKDNVSARNMLGLALFEVGHVGDALKNWIISHNTRRDNNLAATYIEIVNKNSRRLEALNDSIDMYNKALAHIRHKSDDLAIIQLKKAIDLNPRFVDALNLLTLCYLIQNDRERAVSVSERALAIDAQNPVSLNYFALLNPGKRPPRIIPVAATPAVKSQTAPIARGPYKNLETEEKKKKGFHIAELFMFIIGIAVAAAALYFLLVPALRRSWEAENIRLIEAHEQAGAEYLARLQASENAYTAREQEFAEMRLDVARAQLETDILRRSNEVTLAHFEFLAGDLRHAVDRIALAAPLGELPSDIQDRAQSILAEAHPRLGAEYYNAGLAAFNATPRDSFMALAQLENAHRFLNTESAYWNRLLFMLGELYFSEQRYFEAEVALFALNDRTPSPLPVPPFTGAERTRFNEMISDLEAMQ